MSDFAFQGPAQELVQGAGLTRTVNRLLGIAIVGILSNTDIFNAIKV